jgi:hypothetical protein
VSLFTIIIDMLAGMSIFVLGVIIGITAKSPPAGRRRDERPI